MEILKKKKKKGFTLIELLVVIAIIGILASIVLVSVNSARNRAKDSAIQSNVSSVRTESEMLYDDTGSYATLCATGSTFLAYGNLAALQAGITANSGVITCFSGATAYCVQATLNGGGSFCVDSTGASGKTVVACDATFDCATE